jgi:hypothetical protein
MCAIECTRTSEDSVVVDSIMERAIRSSLRFLGFLEASRVPLNSINRLVNTEKDTHALGEELTDLQESIFRVYYFTLILLL